MVAEEMNTAPLARVSATPLAPNRMVSVCTALTTTLTTMSADFAASAGVLAPLPPSATNRCTESAETSQPVTSRPARRSEVAMPKPIEPSPMTATRGLADSGMRRSLRVSILATIRRRLASGYHGLAALPKHEKRLRKQGYVHERNKDPRGNLPPRPLAVRARADAGLVRQHQRETRRWRLAGDADQRLARLARSGADVAARPRRPAGIRRRADQGSSAAHRALPDLHRRPRGRASAFD